METQPNNTELINPKKKVLKKYLGKGGSTSADDQLTAMKGPYYKQKKYFNMMQRVAKTIGLSD